MHNAHTHTHTDLMHNAHTHTHTHTDLMHNAHTHTHTHTDIMHNDHTHTHTHTHLMHNAHTHTHTHPDLTKATAGEEKCQRLNPIKPRKKYLERFQTRFSHRAGVLSCLAVL